MRKYRFVLLPMAALLIIGASAVFFALPRVTALLALRQELAVEKEKLACLTEKISILERLNESQLEQRVLLTERALPSRKAIAEILSAVSALTNETGVTLTEFNISPGRWVSEELETIICYLGVSGEDYERLESFIKALHQTLPVVRVIGFNIERDEAILEVETYSSPLPKSLGLFDTPLPQLSSAEEKAYQEVVGFQSFSEENLAPLPVGKEDLFGGF